MSPSFLPSPRKDGCLQTHCLEPTLFQRDKNTPTPLGTLHQPFHLIALPNHQQLSPRTLPSSLPVSTSAFLFRPLYKAIRAAFYTSRLPDVPATYSIQTSLESLYLYPTPHSNTTHQSNVQTPSHLEALKHKSTEK